MLGGVKLKERTKIVAGLTDFVFLTIVEATRFSGGSLASFLDIFFERQIFSIS
jgi:hypothetical protein